MDESVVTRVMPNSIEAEQSVVGSMILDLQAVWNYVPDNGRHE